ncbi:sigma-70 family RNA polymerase sigma factor [Actinomadura logoneensis]|uniref:sigma-70 family RNA polymerase sigma factor n=1 Tax=Actinomadura logoneensis TaxID=2293572 RepID=UPI001F1BDBC6|nr:sigma-70 family RNA polymerase sigma factor [Actinomadura logoneensis]
MDANAEVGEGSDAALIGRIREGDLTAYGVLYERHVAAARGLAHHLVGGDAAEDAVQDAFAKILDVLGRGGGPRSGFRPYLLTAVRRTVYDRYRGDRRLQSTDQIELFDPGTPFVDPALESLERTMIVRAFRSLPERWQAVLWHTAVEGEKPAEVAPILGLTANGVAALAYRAREGLCQAYLQMHVAASFSAREPSAIENAEAASADGPAEAAPRDVPQGTANVNAPRAGGRDIDASVPSPRHGDAETVKALGAGSASADGSTSRTSARARAVPQGDAAFTGHVHASQAIPAAAALPFGSAAVQVDEKCRPVLEMLGAYVRGGLAKRDTRRVEAHLDDCERCKALYGELSDINTALREVLGPLVLGGAVTAYLSAAAKGGLTGSGVWTWLRHLPKRQQQVLGAGGAAAVVAAGLALALTPVSSNRPFSSVHKPSLAAPPAARPVPGVQAPPPAKAKPPAAQPAPKPPANQPGSLPTPQPKPQAPHGQPPAEVIPAKLDISIGPMGSLVRNEPGIVGMAVRNSGSRPTADLVADVSFPPEVSFAGIATGRRSAFVKPLEAPGTGWSCRPIRIRTGGARCTHAGLPKGETASAYLRVQVGGTAPAGLPPTVTLHSGKQEFAARADRGVVTGGMPARFATDGKVRVTSVGNSLMSCDETMPNCKQAINRQGEEQDDDFWNMRPVDRDDDPSTKSSSAVRLALPPGSSVLWAGMYWSGVAKGSATAPVTARLRPPNGKYQTVSSSEVHSGRLPDFTAYQAFADVTGLVRAHGSGEWWGADVPAVRGASHYAGWSLVVAVKDPAAPLQQVVVLDGPHALGPTGDSSTGGNRADVPLGGFLAAARPAHIGLLGWEGDAGLHGDRLLLDGRPLTPTTGTRDADNVFDSSSLGALGPPLTFGTDVDEFATVLGRHSSLSIETTRDAVLLGVVTVAAPLRS